LHAPGDNLEDPLAVDVIDTGHHEGGVTCLVSIAYSWINRKVFAHLMDIGSGAILTDTYVPTQLEMFDPGGVEGSSIGIMWTVEVLARELPGSNLGSNTSEYLKGEAFGPQR
jgi:hypothetical protein